MFIVKTQAYNSLVRPHVHIEYASAAWSPFEKTTLKSVGGKIFPKTISYNKLFTDQANAWSLCRWLDIGLILFWEFMDLDSVHKHHKKRTWPI